MENHKSNVEILIELIKTLIWPLFAFTLLIGFWEPINKTLEKIPSIIDRSEVITIAGLSLKIEKEIDVKPTAEVKNILLQISSDSVKQLMSNKTSSFYDSKDWPKKQYEELFRLKLLEEINSKELGKHKFGMRPTLLGIKCQKFLDAVIVGIVKQISKK